MRKYFTLLVCLLGMSITVFSQVGQGSLQGKMVDGETGEPLPFANVAVEQNGNPAGGSTTDFDGKFSIKPLSPGKYTLKASYVGFQTIQINDIVVTSNQTTIQNLSLKTEGEILETVEVIDYKEPLIKADDNTQGGKISREQFDRLPTRSVAEATSIVAGSVSDGSGGTSFRGARTNGNQTFIDGIKVRGGSNLPRAAVEEIQVLTGGIPAEVGDITGGATFVTTRGASTASFATVEFLSSGFGYKDGLTQKTWGLDNQGYNLGAFTYGGPILRKKDENGIKKDAILSFIFTSEFTSIVDTRPSIIGSYKLKDDKVNELRSNPYMTPAEIGGNAALSGTILRSEYTVTDNDMEIVDTRQNASQKEINLQSNIKVNTSKNTALSFGGTYWKNKRDVYSNDNAMYNFYNNPEANNRSWRVFGRFTQRFANPLDDEGNETETSIRNAYVSIQMDFEQVKNNGENPNHGDDFFRYGYVGQFNSVLDPTYDLVFYAPLQTVALVQNGWNQTNWNYTYKDINPDLAAYTRQYYDLYKLPDGSPDVVDNYDNINNVSTFTLINGSQPRNVYEMWRGQGFSTGADGQYYVYNNNQFRLSASGAADLKSHEIKVGFEFEQRVDRGYRLVNPNALWAIGRQETNDHIQQLNLDNPMITYQGGVPVVSYPRLVGPTDGYGLASGQFLFDYNLRSALGLPTNGNDYIDFDSYSPEDLKIDYFSADELVTNNSTLGLSYYGYDHTGNKQSGTPTLDDFFNEVDEYGKKTRRIDAFRPIYAAGYIQDKFTFDDLIFRLGLRVDYFDANQPVLIDEYSLFPTVKASETRAANISSPSNVGSDWIVYVNNDNSELKDLIDENTAIIGYRNPEDNSWYDASGALVGRASDLTGGFGSPFPLLQNGQAVSPEKDLNANSFEDYTPQITPMPRISFSFPVSDEASFFANYDILVSRPTSNLQFRPTDYLFIGSAAAINNPNLKPEKTITYEIGFKQALTKNSALSISAFYREMRDQIQAYKFDGAYPRTYTSFDNIDFGTTQGFTLAYDLRRIKNIYLTANYTLQITQGTGSTANSALNLVNASNSPDLRNITYLDYDKRHNFNINFDFHYGEGKNYNGPKIGGKDFLSNSGINLVATAGSGRPFTKWSNTASQVIYGASGGFLESNYNSSRLPWDFNLNARVDKRFKVEFGSKAKDNRKFAMLEVYLQILNLINTQNTLDVWQSTGTPEDDGYLTSTQAQPVIQTAVNPESYIDNYNARIYNPNFYSTQRRMRLGVVLNF